MTGALAPKISAENTATTAAAVGSDAGEGDEDADEADGDDQGGGRDDDNGVVVCKFSCFQIVVTRCLVH